MSTSPASTANSFLTAALGGTTRAQLAILEERSAETELARAAVARFAVWLKGHGCPEARQVGMMHEALAEEARLVTGDFLEALGDVLGDQAERVGAGDGW